MTKQNKNSSQKDGKTGGKKPAIRKPALVRLLDSDNYKKFLEYLRLGAMFQTAAMILRIPPCNMFKWLELGGKKDAKRYYRRFYLDVMQAYGTARLVAEGTVFQEDPKFWLTHGPGKSRFFDYQQAESWADDSRSLNVNMGGGLDIHTDGPDPEQSQQQQALILAGALGILEDMGQIKFTGLLEAPDNTEIIDVVATSSLPEKTNGKPKDSKNGNGK